MCLSKTYFVVLYGSRLLLYSIEDESICFVSAFDIPKKLIDSPIVCISGSFNSNKILLAAKDKSIMYQFKVN